MENLISNDSDCSYCVRHDILICKDEVSAGTENADTDIPNSFFLVPFKKSTKTNLLLIVKASSMPLQFYQKKIPLTLHHCVII